MADCNETIRELDAYLDGELPDDVLASLKRVGRMCTAELQASTYPAVTMR